MDRQNGYFSSHQNYGASANQEYDLYQRQAVNCRQMANNYTSVQLSTQTENHGTNIFNFYLMNPGTHRINISLSGFPEIGEHGSVQAQVAHRSHLHPTYTQSEAGLYSTGTVFQPQYGHSTKSTQSSGTYAATNQCSTSSTPTQVCSTHSQPTSSKMSRGTTSQPAVDGNGNGNGFQHRFSCRKTPHSNFVIYCPSEDESDSQSSSDD